MGEALGIVELVSIARGVLVSDAMVKRAEVTIVRTHPISPGHYLVVVDGGVAEVEEAMGAGLACADDTLLDSLFLPLAHVDLGPLVRRQAHRDRGPSAPGRAALPENDSLAIVETHTVCAAVLGADAAAKAARVRLLDLRLGQGLGGRGFFTLTGELFDIEAAVAAATDIILPARLVGVEIIAAPHHDLSRDIMWE